MAFPWEPFLERYRPLARNVAAGITGRRDDADDIVQEAALALLDALRRDPDRFDTLQHARNYLLKTVRQLALQKLRRSRPTRALDAELPAGPSDLTGSTEADDELRERRRRVARALGELSAEELDLIRQRFAERRTLADIARSTGVAISTLHSREKALLDRLRRRVGPSTGPKEREA